MTGEWLELVSDPDLFTLLLKDFGVRGVRLMEIYDVEQPLDGPVYGMIFLFKWVKEIRRRGRPRKNANIPTSAVGNDGAVRDVFFARQMVPNSCATHALLSVLLNTDAQLHLGGTLKRLKERTRGLDPEAKGWAIGNTPALAWAHNKRAVLEPDDEEATNAAAKNAEYVDCDTYHFISYVPIGGRLYELDGLKPYPTDHGPWAEGEDWTAKFRRVVAARMAAGADAGYNLMAVVPDQRTVVPDQRTVITRKLDMLTANRQIVLETLEERTFNMIVTKVDGDLSSSEKEPSPVADNSKSSCEAKELSSEEPIEKEEPVAGPSRELIEAETRVKMTGEWLELVSDPDLFTLLLKDFGVRGVRLMEIYDVEQPLDGPAYGMLFLFKWVKEIRRRGRPRKNANIPTSAVGNDGAVRDVFFARQMVPNSCATHALLSVLLNTDAQLHLGGTLERLKERTRGLDPEAKGWAIGNTPALAWAHNKRAVLEPDDEEATNAAAKNAEYVDCDTYHFISYVPIGGRLYELDGLKPYPTDHGPWAEGEDWTAKFRRVVAARMAAGADAGYNLMAVVPDQRTVVPDQRTVITRKLDMLTANRQIVLETLEERTFNMIVTKVDGDPSSSEKEPSPMADNSKSSCEAKEQPSEEPTEKEEPSPVAGPSRELIEAENQRQRQYEMDCNHCLHDYGPLKQKLPNLIQGELAAPKKTARGKKQSPSTTSTKQGPKRKAITTAIGLETTKKLKMTKKKEGINQNRL